MSEMITKNHELVTQFGDTLDRLLNGIENFVANSRPTLGSKRFLTDKEVSAQLKVSRRTLQDYRNNGIIAYYQLGGKVLYKESDIERMLAAHYRESFKKTDT
jgi:excisionase family DNA binding protein